MAASSTLGVVGRPHRRTGCDGRNLFKQISYGVTGTFSRTDAERFATLLVSISGADDWDTMAIVGVGQASLGPTDFSISTNCCTYLVNLPSPTRNPSGSGSQLDTPSGGGAPGTITFTVTSLLAGPALLFTQDLNTLLWTITMSASFGIDSESVTIASARTGTISGLTSGELKGTHTLTVSSTEPYPDGTATYNFTLVLS
jgi:hypothetical protein